MCGYIGGYIPGCLTRVRPNKTLHPNFRRRPPLPSQTVVPDADVIGVMRAIKKDNNGEGEGGCRKGQTRAGGEEAEEGRIRVVAQPSKVGSHVRV